MQVIQKESKPLNSIRHRTVIDVPIGSGAGCDLLCRRDVVLAAAEVTTDGSWKNKSVSVWLKTAGCYMV